MLQYKNIFSPKWQGKIPEHLWTILSNQCLLCINKKYWNPLISVSFILEQKTFMYRKYSIYILVLVSFTIYVWQININLLFIVFYILNIWIIIMIKALGDNDTNLVENSV